MKKVYSTPKAVAEEFEANEYVAACYSIRCEFGGDNPYSAEDQVTYWNIAEYGSGVTHGGSCTEASRDYILDSDGGATPGASIREYSSDQGYITGHITAVYGNTVYWYTQDAGGTRRWNHKGTLTAADSAHPNRS